MSVVLFLIIIVSGFIYGVTKYNVIDDKGNINKNANFRGLKKELIIWFLVGLVISFLAGGIKFVSVGEAGVIFNKFSGMTDKKLKEGINWVNPMTEKSKIYDIKITKAELRGLEGLSLDSQTITLDLVINYKLDSFKLREIYQTIYGDIKENILYNAVVDTAKAELGKFRIDDVAKNRESLKKAIEDTLKSRLKEKYIDIINVSVTNVNYSETYEKAIEAKLVAEQEALEARNQKEKTRYLAEAKAIENKNLANTITPMVLKQKWLEKWDGKLPQVMTNGDSNLLMNVNGLE